jgi:hypothetical protein
MLSFVGFKEFLMPPIGALDRAEGAQGTSL